MDRSRRQDVDDLAEHDEREGARERAPGKRPITAGFALPDALRARFERSLGVDLAGVRVHTDDDATVRGLGARAFAYGDHITVDSSHYDPGSAAGQQLLAHEVAHTVQQRGAAAVQRKPVTTERGDASEVEADLAADAMMTGQAARVSAAPARIARDNPGSGPSAPTTDLRTDMFTVDTFDLNMAGSVRAAPSSGPDATAGNVTITAPNITIASQVTLKSTVTLGDGQSVEVGPTQTLMGSERVGIYKRADGTITAEDHATVGQVRDARWNQNRDGSVSAAVPAPWYQQPTSVSDTNRTSTATYRDQPSFDIPQTMAGGQLRETRGADSFVTAISAKRGSNLVHLRNLEWSVPWALQLDASETGTGGALPHHDAASGPPTTDGPIAVQAAQEWLRFPTVADAVAAGAIVCLRNIPIARTRDPDSYNNMVAAVRQLNPMFTIQLKCTNSYSWFSSDSVSFHARGTNSHDWTFDLNTNQTHSMQVSLTELWDPATWQDGRELAFSATVEGHALSASWGFPFEGADAFTSMRGSEGRYQISATLSPH